MADALDLSPAASQARLASAMCCRMKCVLITGMSGTGKSTVIRALAELGYRAIDTDHDDFTQDIRSGDGTERLEHPPSATATSHYQHERAE